jgi:hypothetical protein
VRVARIAAVVALFALVAGLTVTFGVTYRDQSHRLARVQRERDTERARNRRLEASLASAQAALTSLNAGLASSRADIVAARETAGARYRDGYAAGFLWVLGGDPYGAVDALDAGSASGWYGR